MKCSCFPEYFKYLILVRKGGGLNTDYLNNNAVNMILKASWPKQVHCFHWPYTVPYNENCEFWNDDDDKKIKIIFVKKL